MVGAPPLVKLVAISKLEFQEQFGQTAIGCIRYDRFLRNVTIALGNWGNDEATPALIKVISHPSALVRGHAAWALGQIGSSQAKLTLQVALGREQDPFVREELERALGNIPPVHLVI